MVGNSSVGRLVISDLQLRDANQLEPIAAASRLYVNGSFEAGQPLLDRWPLILESEYDFQPTQNARTIFDGGD
jgi:hypothetical protein